MDLFFRDLDAVPLPPREVRIKELRALPLPDNRRVRIYLEVTPFQKRPDGEITITNSNGYEVASLSIIETIVTNMELTVHLRETEPEGEYSVSAIVFYPEKQEVEGSDEVIESHDLKRIIVDQAETKFSI